MLRQCPACNHPVSPEAHICPSCGHPLPAKERAAKAWLQPVAWLFTGLAVVCALIWFKTIPSSADAAADRQEALAMCLFWGVLAIVVWAFHLQASAKR